MPKWTLLIWVPIALLAACKLFKHERALSSQLGPRRPAQRILQLGMLVPIGLVATIAFMELIGSAFK